ncbi:MAG TPA: hypothetical protein PKE03_12455 [Bacteroidales bacterium]|nr:hypothetical protein [Bacteroidales bacterium]
MNRQQPKEEVNKRKRFMVYMIFLAISGLLWLLIKINNVYTVKFPVTLTFSDPPPGIWLEDEFITQELEAELQSRGYELLRVVLFNKKKPIIHASMRSLSPRKVNQYEYYVTAQTLKNLVASHLGLGPDEVVIAENELRFRATQLTSKKVKVVPRLDIFYDPSFGPYGQPEITPDSIEIYAINSVIDTLKFIPTEARTYRNTRNQLADSLKLNMQHPSMSAAHKKVFFVQQVEQFTETTALVDIESGDAAGLKIFPNRTLVIYNVALKDFGKVDAGGFTVEVDTSGLAKRSAHLFLKVSRIPPGVQLVRLDPGKVEYLIPVTR